MSRLPPLRSRLLLLAAGSVLPLLILALALAWMLVQGEEDTARRAAQERNHTLSSAIDAQMRGHAATLRALASSAALERGNLAAFDIEARRVQATQPDWLNVTLLSPQGRQLLNTRLPAGVPLPMRGDAASFEQALQGGGAVIGNMSQGPASGQWGVPVRLPIVRGGQVAYVIQFVLRPEALGRLMREQGYPSEWTVGLVDTHGRILTRLPDRPPGDRILPDTWARMQDTDEGWIAARTVEGKQVFSAYTRSAFTRWTVGTSIPAQDLRAASRRAALLLGLGALVTIAVAAVFAWRLGRRIAEPIDHIAAAARALGRGPAPDLSAVARAPYVREVREVAAALDEAAASLAEREALRQREQDALRAADRAKDEFLAMLGHELRNPLSAITASAHVLRLSQPGTEASSRAHAVIDRQARQMTRLVEDLLDISRIAMGKVALHPEPIDLAALVAGVVAIWRGARPERQQRDLALDLAPAPVLADRARMEQVVGNLLDNAEKFSPRGSRIAVQVAPRGGRAMLQVQDEGQGIPSEDLARIFDPFVQGEQSIDRPQGGIGLGLTLVRRLLAMQGGSIDAASDGRGKGARFTVQLPLQAGAGQVPAAAPSATGAPGRRVLVVEDNEDGRAMLESMLTLEGHVVHGVGTGLAGVQAARELRPDFVIVDIGLPDIDGCEVARRIRAMRLAAEPRLLALSGYGQAHDRERALAAGFDLHLAKPVAPEQLSELVGGQAATPTSR